MGQMTKRLFLAASALTLLATTSAQAGACGTSSCWQFNQTSAGDAETPKDILKVFQTYKHSPAVIEAVQRIAIFAAAGIQPAVSVAASHYTIGYFKWVGPTACSDNDPRLKTGTVFQHNYCLSNNVCVQGDNPVPPNVDPCASDK